MKKKVEQPHKVIHFAFKHFLFSMRSNFIATSILLQPKEMVLGFDVQTPPPPHPKPEESGLQPEDWGQSPPGTWTCFDKAFRTRVLNLGLQQILKTPNLNVRLGMNGHFCPSLQLSSDFQRNPLKVRIFYQFLS